jgi:hypothetical protein
VLIELTRILGEYREDIILVGGWIPDLLISQSPEPLVGSIDVDLALNRRELADAPYRMIGETLRSHGHEEDDEQPFIFRKKVRGQVVQVDFLAGKYGGTGKKPDVRKGRSTFKHARHGAATLRSEIEPASVTASGQLPDRPPDEVTIRIAGSQKRLAISR